MTDGLDIFAPLINPWNGIVAIATLLVIEVVKSAFPAQFVNGNAGNRLLRPLCVVGCAVGYQIDGPWITGDMDPWLRLFVGGLVGAATTIGYAGARTLVKKITTRTEKSVLDAIKKWTAVLGALAAAVSGVYGAWFRPESGAKQSYELMSQAIEELSADVDKLHKSDTTMDKTMAVELARMGQRLDDMQALLEAKLAYEPAELPPPPPPEPVIGTTEVMVSNDAKPAPKPEIRRQGLQIQMPSAEEVGF
jgi:hypothetical protein